MCQLCLLQHFAFCKDAMIACVQDSIDAMMGWVDSRSRKGLIHAYGLGHAQYDYVGLREALTDHKYLYGPAIRIG